MQIGYRLTVFSGSLFYTGSDALYPVSGAAHNEAFKITTMPSGSVAGYAPYMRIPQGNRGETDLSKGSATVGTYSVEILDARTGAGNESRWVTAFIGDANADLTIVGKKAVIEETLDNGTTWSPFFVGRINTIDLRSNLTFTIELGDAMELLKEKIFTSEPNVSYATFRSQLPVGYIKDITVLDGRSTIPGTPGLQVNTVVATAPRKLPGDILEIYDLDYRVLTFKNSELNRLDNIWDYSDTTKTGDWRYGANSTGLEYSVANSSEQYQYRVLVYNNGNYYRYGLLSVTAPANANKANTKQSIEQIQIAALPSADRYYSAITSVSAGDKPLIWVYKLMAGADEKIGNFAQGNDDDKLTSLLLNQTPYNVLRDVLRGNYFTDDYVTVTDPIYYLPTTTRINKAIAFDESAIAAVETAFTSSKVLFRMEEPMSALDFIEKHICQPFSLAYTFVPQLFSGSIQSVFKLFSTNVPLSIAGAVTLDNTNITTVTPGWGSGEPIAGVRGKYYIENVAPIVKKDNNAVIPDVVTLPYTIIVTSPTALSDPTYKQVTVDFNAVRGVNYDTGSFRSLGLMELVPATIWGASLATKLATNIFNRYKSGNSEITVDCIRDATTNAIEVGDFVLVSSDVLPNPSLHERGGTRIFQVTNKNISGIKIKFTLFDTAVNTTCNTPSFGAFAATIPNRVSSSITTTDNVNVQLEYAVVTAGGAQPSVNSSAWLYNATYPISASTLPISINYLPEGRSIYLRARSATPDRATIKLPSAYVYSSAYSMSGIFPPTNVVVSAVTTRGATVTWANPNVFYFSEILLASPSGVPTSSIIQLPPSSSYYSMVGLNLNTSASHTVGVRYIDGYGGFSTMASASFTASGSAATLDAPAALLFYIRK